MKALLNRCIAEECEKLIRRHFEYLRDLDDEIKRKRKRLGIAVSKHVYKPAYWDIDKRFNPFKVRRRLDTYAYTLSSKIRNEQYEPHTSLITDVEKEDGSPRRLNIFQIPDAALSRLVYKSLLHKNQTRLSSYAYGYRDDRTAHDAINEIFSDWRNQDRLYVAEFDYSKFFDNITHEYLWDVFVHHRFIATPHERQIINAFLKSRASLPSAYNPPQGDIRDRGIPQGTSISLFLANLACWELDRSLERLGVGFARYADDTLIWSPDYSKAVRAYEFIKTYGERMGVPINVSKSEGISLVTRPGLQGEIRTKSDVAFLGYKIGTQSIAIKKSRISKIKQRIGYLIYQNLLQPLKNGIYNSARLGQDIDYDYVVALYQVRRYLYGGLDNDKLNHYIIGAVPHLNFRGLMSYYPLVNDDAQLRMLDGWLIHTLKQSLVARQRLWATQNRPQLPGPTLDWIKHIDGQQLFQSADSRRYDLRIPSFSLIQKAVYKAIEREGIRAVSNPRSLYYGA